MGVHFTVRGEIGGRRAEVRLEPGQIRVQALTIVTRQPALDATFPFRELTDLRLVRRVQWTYVVVALLLAILIGGRLPESIRSSGWVASAIAILFFPVTFGLVAWLLPKNSVRMATQDSLVEVDVSTFSRKRVRELINAVRQERPDLAG